MMLSHKFDLRATTGDRASEPARPRTLPLLTRAAWRWLRLIIARLERSRIGDAIGCACLFILFFALCVSWSPTP